ncbi:TRAP transporter small permease subunit [Yoonia algicola]|uniref:TRAP transporter small permease protein n=1 Tax=Yoonia algicola TaxID=3137368 RepID=A0AAN0M3R7_9RHOB
MGGLINRSASWLNGIATIWAFLLAVVILVDVVGRSFFGQPLQGTKEIVANSIVAIVFLQFPLAVREKAFLRTTLVYDHLPGFLQRVVDSAGYLIGFGFFAAMAWGGWPDMMIGWRIGEFEGEGAFRVPVYPVRTIIVVLSALCAVGFLIQTVLTIMGRDQTATATISDMPDTSKDVTPVKEIQK